MNILNLFQNSTYYSKICSQVFTHIFFTSNIDASVDENLTGENFF